MLKAEQLLMLSQLMEGGVNLEIILNVVELVEVD